ncbi:MAG: oligosaccharide flippase family protein [Bacteroidetes bacterium]|nr:oligosaccharide flippase family protein [Bacteroidota bacterium]
MLERLKSTVRDTFIYSLSNIAPKVVGVILLPLFTAKLVLTDFGNWDLLDNTIQILAEVVILGQASSLIFLNNNKEYEEQKGSALFTLTTFVLAVCAVLVLASEIITAKFSAFFAHSQITAEYIRLTAYIVLLRVMNNLFLAKVRADEESAYYSTVSVAKTLVMTFFTVYLVAYENQGITGILLAALIAEFLTTIALLTKLIPVMKLNFNKEILSVAFKFGFPLVFSSLGFMLLNQSDRFIIKILLGSKHVALYGLAYRIAGVLNMFLVLPFSLGLLPIAYKYFGQPDDNRFFSKLMTYSTFVFVWGFVFLSLFSKEIVRLFAQQSDFYSAYLVVPLILLSYVFSGMRLTASLGMMLTKNTKHIAWITIGASALNIILNFIFIPMYGIMAAAVNTLVSFVIFYLITQKVSNKYFRIDFENRKLLLMIVAGSIFASAIYLLPAMNNILQIAVKLIITILFPVVLFLFKFYEKAELDILTSPSKIIDFIKGIIKGAAKPPTDTDAMIRP